MKQKIKLSDKIKKTLESRRRYVISDNKINTENGAYGEVKRQRKR